MSMKLMILGLLMEQDRHPYEMRQAMITRNWNFAFKLRDGSLYYAVDQLREKGMIEATEVVIGEHGPDKTIYRITEAGRSEFLSLMYTQLAQSAHPQHPMMMAMPFLRHGDPQQITDITVKQLAACEQRIQKLEETLRERGHLMPRSARRMVKGMLLYGQAERAWLQETVREAQQGLYAEEHGPNRVWQLKPRQE